MHARFRTAALALSVSAGFAGLALSSAPAIASTHVNPHATVVCTTSDPACTNISNLMLNGDNEPTAVLNATTGQAAIGRRLNLRQFSNTRTNEDFSIKFVGTLGELCPNFVHPVPGQNSLDPTSYACLHYSWFYPVYQGNFAPDSNETGQCVGALAATDGFKLRLVRCGDPRSFWVADLAAQIVKTTPDSNTLYYAPLEFAADHAASNPLVATFVPDSKNPVNKVVLHQENFTGSGVQDRQMWTLTGQPSQVVHINR